MGNSKLIPYETIVRATSGEPEAVEEVLRHYSRRIRLAASPGRVFTKAQIFEAVWSMGSESCQSSVTNVICNLRKKIEPDSRNPIYIKTILGIGYKFVSGE